MSHNLGSDPGMVIIKRTDSTSNWEVFHRSLSSGNKLVLNSTGAQSSGADITATSSTNITLSDSFVVNGSSATYVGYFFAHNNNDGGFGPDSEDIIKCGSFTGVGTGAVNVNLGFEPQWIMVKNASRAEGWFIQDSMRGMADTYWEYLLANEASAAAGQTADRVVPTATGFTINNNGSSAFGQSGDTCIYMAIRRPDQSTPTAASDVFKVDQGHSSNTPNFESGFPLDFGLLRQTSGDNFKLSSRLTHGKYLETTSTAAESSNSNYSFDFQNGWVGSAFGTSYYSWMWKRATGFCDVVAYDGGGGSSINHNLGVTPEMYWIKCRSDGSTNRWWADYHKDVTTQASKYLRLDSNQGLSDLGVFHNGTIDASTFSANNGYSVVNESGQTYIAYLFATLSGISKVGSFTQSGATNVDCGFTGSTPALIILKRHDSSGDWIVFDSVRGIVAGNDPSMDLNNSDAEVTNADIVDPYSSGFATTSSLANGNYIFYAVAGTS